MNFQLTDYGVNLFKTAPTPPVLDMFRIGSAFNYLPASTDTNIRGTLLDQGTPGLPVVISANVIRYSVLMDTSIGTFQYGECGLFYQGQLVALGAESTLRDKIKAGVTDGNLRRIDAYLSEVGLNFDMNSDQAESSNAFRLSRLQSVDMLPQVGNTSVNAFVIAGQSSAQSAVMAFTDKQALWNFTDYAFGIAQSATVTAVTTNSVTIAAADYSENIRPDYRGEIIMQLASGPLYSICRFIDNAQVSGANVVMQFSTAFATLPNVGDKLWFYRRNDYSTQEPTIPIATATVLGAIKIGAGLIVLPDGTCSVDIPAASVTSVNGQTGTVTINAQNLPGLATVGKSGSYNDLLDKPNPYTLPPANNATLGGIKVGAGLAVTADGTLSAALSLPVATSAVLGGVKIGAGINVTADGTISAASIAPATASTLGVVKIGSGITVAGDGTISAALAYTLPIASVGALGGIRVGAGLSIDGSGVLSTTSNYTLPAATSGTLGGIKVGTTLTVAVDGLLNYNLPIAGTNTLGGVKIGAGINVSGDGTISVTSGYTLPIATAGTLGGVKIGSGISTTGDGTIFVTPATDANKLDRINGIATGLRYAHVNLGTVVTTLPIDFSAANSQFAQVGAGALAWSFTNLPIAGVYGELQLMLRNGGLATSTFPTSVWWVNPDGTFTQDFAAYIGAQRVGATSLQTSGLDFIIFFTVDGGVTVYGKVL